MKPINRCAIYIVINFWFHSVSCLKNSFKGQFNFNQIYSKTKFNYVLAVFNIMF